MNLFLRITPLGLVAVAIACSTGTTDLPPPAPGGCVRTDIDHPPVPARKTARWAFEPWISKDISNRADTYDFVGGFQSRGIPIGAVVLDSPWETQYNTFVPSPTRYGDFPGLVSDMHAKNVKVVLWITQMVNDTSFDFEPGADLYTGASPNFDEGQNCRYFLDDGASFVWWKGRGGAVDFFNPDATAWWHRQQDNVLDMGIDGWKLDFGESYLKEDTVKTSDGQKPFLEYSQRYYADYLAYGRMKRGADFLTMVRAWDVSYDFAGRFFAKPEDAPVAWMGDNRRDYLGLADALDEAFVSADAGYVVLGSDIGGYLDVDDLALTGPKIPFDTTVFARWTAIGALSPFMQLHGRANLAPWTVADHVDETVALYKYWATLHHALVPYLYASSEEVYAGQHLTPGGACGDDCPKLVRPIGTKDQWKGDYRYQLGDAFLVAPLLDGTGKRTVAFPAGGRWFDWWTGDVHDGGTSADADFSADRAKVPLYVKEGAIVPMTIDSDVLALGTDASKGALTVLVWPGPAPTTFRLREDDDAITIITASPGTVTISAAPKPLVLRIRAETDPTSVTASGAAMTRAASASALDAAGAGFFYDAALHTLIVRAPAAALELAFTP